MNTKQLCAALSALCFAEATFAATLEVETVAELTNAVARVNAGEEIGGEAIDTIRLKKGTYTFTDEMMDASNGNIITVGDKTLTIEGEDDSPRKTWTEGDEPVVIDGSSLGRILYFDTGSKVKTIRNICFTRGKHQQGGVLRSMTVGAVTATNCVFRQNSAAQSGGDQSAAVSMWVTLRDCLVKESTGGTAVRGGSASETLYAYGCDFVGHSREIATYSFSAYDCNFYCNTNTSGAVIGTSLNVTATNCKFIGNKGKYLAKGKSFIDCEFSDNIFEWMFRCGQVDMVGCTFKRNESSLLTKYDGNGSTELAGTLTVANCHFIENTATEFASEAGDSVRALIRGFTNRVDELKICNSTFSNNYNKTSSCVGLCTMLGVHAERCSFLADANAPFSGYPQGESQGYHNDAAKQSVLKECDVSAGELRDCVIDRCVVHDVTNNVYAVFRDYVRVTNTLVKCCKRPANGLGGVYHPYTGRPFDAEFVNCTFVSNALLTIDARWNNYSVTNGCDFINCLFNGNSSPGGLDSDFSIPGNDSGSTRSKYVNNLVRFSSSYYGKFSSSDSAFVAAFAAITNGVNTLSLCADPKFVRDSQPDAPYWSLSLKSPLLDKGDPLDFTGSDLDLAGHLRLKDGHIDPGCYQCWLRPLGFMLMVR